jgi:hypothetical protein
MLTLLRNLQTTKRQLLLSRLEMLYKSQGEGEKLHHTSCEVYPGLYASKGIGSMFVSMISWSRKGDLIT